MTPAHAVGFDLIHAQGLSSLESDVVTTHICNRAWFETRKRFDPSTRTSTSRLHRNILSLLAKCEAVACRTMRREL
jgi:hypothetical protein